MRKTPQNVDRGSVGSDVSHVHYADLQFASRTTLPSNLDLASQRRRNRNLAAVAAGGSSSSNPTATGSFYPRTRADV